MHQVFNMGIGMTAIVSRIKGRQLVTQHPPPRHERIVNEVQAAEGETEL